MKSNLTPAEISAMDAVFAFAKINGSVTPYQVWLKVAMKNQDANLDDFTTAGFILEELGYLKRVTSKDGYDFLWTTKADDLVRQNKNLIDVINEIFTSDTLVNVPSAENDQGEQLSKKLMNAQLEGQLMATKYYKRAILEFESVKKRWEWQFLILVAGLLISYLGLILGIIYK